MALPSDLATRRLTGHWTRFDGQPDAGTITLIPSVGHIYGADLDVAVTRVPVVFNLDKDGKITGKDGAAGWPVATTDDPEYAPDGWDVTTQGSYFTYELRVKLKSGYTVTLDAIEVPASTAALDLLTVVPVAPVEEVSSYVLAAERNQAGGFAGISSDGVIGGLVVNAAFHGAVGDGVADDTAALQAAANAAAGGTLYIPTGTFLTSDTIHLTESTNVRFAGRGAVLKYTGSGSAIQATTFMGLVIDGAGTVDLSGAGDAAVGIHLAGIWHSTVSDMQVIQGPPNSTGVLIETSEPGTTFYYGAFCITINNLDLLDGDGLYGIRAMKTPTDPSDINSVTHLQVNNGWCKGKRTGLHLSKTSTVHINGYCVDTAYDGYYVEKSAGVILKPGELGPVDHWAITFGTTPQEVANIVLLPPPYVGVMGDTQLGYLDTSLIQPTVFDMSTVALRGSAGGESGSENYYSILQSLYQYSKSLSWTVRGGGNEHEMLSWSDTGGLVLDGGAKTTVATDLEVQGTISSSGPSRHVVNTVALVDEAMISTDCSQGNIFEVTLGGDRTMGTPANALDGQRILYRLTQDATGSRLITWSSLFRFSSTYPEPTLSTAPGATDYVEFMWNVDGNAFDCLGYSVGHL